MKYTKRYIQLFKFSYLAKSLPDGSLAIAPFLLWFEHPTSR